MTGGSLLRPLRRHLTPIVLCAALGAALGFAASVVVPVRYTSSATVLVSPVSAEPAQSLSANVADVDVETEVIVAESRRVAELANEILDNEPPGTSGSQPDGQVSARSVGDSRVMRISFESDTAEKARRGAAAYANAYVQVREDFLAEQQRVAEEQLEERIDELKFLLGDLPTVDPDDRSPESVAVSIERATLESELLVNQRALADLKTVSTDVATIVDPAQLPSSPSSLSLPTLVVSGAVLGLAVGAAIALLADAVRQRPPAQAEAVVVPDPAPAMQAGSPAPAALGVAAMGEPGPPVAHPSDEDLRRLNQIFQQVTKASTGLMPSIRRRVVADGQALIVVDDDGQSSASVALALSSEIARRGVRTLLVETSKVEPSLSQLAGVPAQPGLGDLRSGEDLTRAPHPYPGVSRLSLLTAGAAEMDPREMAAVLVELARDQDALVVIGGRASLSPILNGVLPAGAAIVATQARADPVNLRPEDFEAIEGSAHQLIGIVSIGDHPLPGAPPAAGSWGTTN